MNAWGDHLSWNTRGGAFCADLGTDVDGILDIVDPDDDDGACPCKTLTALEDT